MSARSPWAPGWEPCADGGPAFEVIYLLEGGRCGGRDPAADPARRTRRLARRGRRRRVSGTSMCTSTTAGAAVEAGVEAGRPYRIRITHFDTATGGAARAGCSGRSSWSSPGRVWRACARGGGRDDGAGRGRGSRGPAGSELVDAIRCARRARGGPAAELRGELRHTAAAAAEQARTEGVRVALILPAAGYGPGASRPSLSTSRTGASTRTWSP